MSWIYIDPALTNYSVVTPNGQNFLTSGVDYFVSSAGAAPLDSLPIPTVAAFSAPVGFSHLPFDYAVMLHALGWFLSLYIAAYAVGVVYKILVPR